MALLGGVAVRACARARALVVILCAFHAAPHTYENRTRRPLGHARPRPSKCNQDYVTKHSAIPVIILPLEFTESTVPAEAK